MLLKMLTISLVVSWSVRRVITWGGGPCSCHACTQLADIVRKIATHHLLPYLLLCIFFMKSSVYICFNSIVTMFS